MKEKLTFATVFPYMENIHLVKDPGMIPYIMQKKYGCESIVPISSLCEYEYKKGFYSEIKTPIIKDSGNHIRRKISKRIFWIIKNAKKIDILHLYFFDRITFFTIYIYRLFNPQGLVYVHCDTDGEFLLSYTPPKNVLKRVVIKLFLSPKNIDNTLWGIQNRKNAEKLRGKWPFVNVKYVPNGFYWENENTAKNISKENILLTVGRIGAEEKRTDLLLEAFEAISKDFPQWKLELVGPIDATFSDFINQFLLKHPFLAERIQFVGPIYDRKELQQHFQKAKVFALPSQREGFPLSVVEALSQGCFIIGSNLPAIVEMISGKYGVVFENGDREDFIQKLNQLLRCVQHSSTESNDIAEYASSSFRWEKILDPVYIWIQGKIAEKKIG